MTSVEPRPRSRVLILLLVSVLGIALGAGGIAALRPFGAATQQRLTAEARRPAPARHISARTVYARVRPSVVDVTATLGYDDETASGTGLVINSRVALVLTNNHVIRDATSVTVTIPGSMRSYPARIVGADVPADVAVLEIRPVPGIAAAPLGNSAAIGVGAQVVAIGNRAGSDGSPALAPGVITGTGRTISAADTASGYTETLHGMLQTTARIEPGDSGGPLADSAGAVIGMDTAAGSGGNAAGYAIPINVAMAAGRQIASGHRGPGIALGVGGFLGVIVPSTAATSPRAQAAEEHGLRTNPASSDSRIACLPTEAGAQVPSKLAPVRSGALVDGVLCDTAAAAAGIAPGDVITSADGRHVSSPDALTAIVGACRPGSVITVTWVSPSGATRSALVRLDPAPAP